MHGYHKPTDTVFCVRVKSWRIDGDMLVAVIWCDALKEGPKVCSIAWGLEKGCRYYVVENDPKDCQEPNGPIVWRWQGGKIVHKIKPKVDRWKGIGPNPMQTGWLKPEPIPELAAL